MRKDFAICEKTGLLAGLKICSEEEKTKTDKRSKSTTVVPPEQDNRGVLLKIRNSKRSYS